MKTERFEPLKDPKTRRCLRCGVDVFDAEKANGTPVVLDAEPLTTFLCGTQGSLLGESAAPILVRRVTGYAKHEDTCGRRSR